MTHNATTAKTAASDLTVRVSRIIRAPREHVFEAWINPDLRRRWWHHGSGLSACEIDARVGGAYRMVQVGGCSDELNVPPDFKWVMEGEFVEIVRPAKIVFTWNVNHDPPVVDTRVTVELREVPGGTEVTLTHVGLQSKEMRDGTDTGWSELLESIDKLLAKA